MAQLKDTIVQGSLRVTDTLYTYDISISKSQTKNWFLATPSSADGAPSFRTITTDDLPLNKATDSFYAPITAGTVNQVLVSSGSGAPTWKATANGAAYATSENGALTFGTLPIAQGGTTATTAVAARTNLNTATGNGRIFYGTSTSTADSTVKTVVCTAYEVSGSAVNGYFTPDTGDILVVTFTNTNSAAVGSLQLQIINASENPTLTTTAINIKCQVQTSVGNLPSVGYLVASRPYMFIYDGEYWVMMNVNRDNNDNSIGYYIRYNNGTFTTITTLNRYKLLLQYDETSFVPASITNTTNGTKTDVTQEKFLIFGNYCYYSTNGATSQNTAVDSAAVWLQYGFNLNYSFNIASTLTEHKDVYLVAIPDTDGIHAKLRNPTAVGNDGKATATGSSAGPITQTLPQSDDGYIYIRLGHAYSSTNMTLTLSHPVYWYKDGKLRPYSSVTKTMVGLSNVTNDKQLPIGGGTMTGPLITNILQGTSGSDYGSTLPSTNLTGRIFFQTGANLYELPTGGTTGQLLIKHSNADRDVEWGSTIPSLTVTGNVTAAKVFNAVWNDYAECRNSYIEEPGRVIMESSSGSMELANERLLAGCKIISDTYGSLMGKTHNAKTPIAVAGRVLAYPYQDKDKYELGAAVCSAPNGTVDIMTREEIREYPERIIGTVSEIPNYKIWYAGNEKNPIPIEVKDRIWIYVR